MNSLVYHQRIQVILKEPKVFARLYNFFLVIDITSSLSLSVFTDINFFKRMLCDKVDFSHTGFYGSTYINYLSAILYSFINCPLLLMFTLSSPPLRIQLL